MSTDTWKKKVAKQTEKPVNGILATFACLICVGTSGMLAMKLSDPDQGQVVTLAEVQVRMQNQADRLRNDPHIPPRFKSFALGMIERGRMMGVELNKRSKR